MYTPLDRKKEKKKTEHLCLLGTSSSREFKNLACSSSAMEALVVVLAAAAAMMGISGCEAVVLREPNRPTELCECVPYYDCNAGGRRNTTCPHFLEICCQQSHIIRDEPCTCMPFFECTTKGIESETKKCPRQFDVCCVDSTEELPNKENEPTSPSKPPSQPNPTGGPCTTIGTRSGVCIPYKDCSEKLQEPIRLLTIDQFLHNYGCGIDSKKVARVCCPSE